MIKNIFKGLGLGGLFTTFAAFVGSALGLLTPLFALIGGEPRLWISLGGGAMTLAGQVPWLTQQQATWIFGCVMTLIVLRTVHVRYYDNDT